MTPAPFGELLNWRNAHGAAFVRDGQGGVWVSDSAHLTPALRAAIRVHQEALSVFLPPETRTPTPEASPVPQPAPSQETDSEWATEFLAELNGPDDDPATWDAMTEAFCAELDAVDLTAPTPAIRRTESGWVAVRDVSA